MVKVVFKSANNKIVGFKVSGHADSAPHGQDLVCAAVSSITIGTLNALQKLTTIDLSKCQVSSGLVVLNDITDDEVGQVILNTFKIQIETIEESYGKYIRLNTQEV